MWLPLLFCCLSLTVYAGNISITGYIPAGEYNDEPLYVLDETQIQVSLENSEYLTEIRIDDNVIFDDYNQAYNSYVLDISKYLDYQEHKLEILYGAYVEYGICYFRFDDAWIPNPGDAYNIHYEVQGDSAVVSYIDGSVKIAVIKPEYDGYPVKSIGSRACSYSNNLVSVRIPASVTSISKDAFEGCENIKRVDFDATNCNILDISWYDGNLFPASLEKISFGNNITKVPDYICSGCSNLKSVVIPNSVTTIGSSAFLGCSGLTSMELGDSVTTIENYAFYDCSGLSKIELPYSLSSIGERSFYNCSGLSSIEIPNSVTRIGLGAFQCCNGLTWVHIPALVAKIGHVAFGQCENLSGITVDSSNQFYASENGTLFTKDKSLLIQWPYARRHYDIPSCVKKLGSGCFFGCKGMRTILIPNSITEIGEAAFAETDLENITLPESVTTIASQAFYNCKSLSYIYIPSSVSLIGNKGNIGVFGGCQISTVEFESIESAAKIKYDLPLSNPLSCADHIYFNGVEVKNLVIPNTISHINYYAFRFPHFTSLTIPESVSSIGSWAFDICSDCKFVTCFAEVPPALGFSVFYKKIPVLYVPTGSVVEYQNSDWAQYFMSIEEIKNNLTVEIEGKGNVYANGFNEVESGEIFNGTDFTFFVLPDEGQQIRSVTLDGEDITTSLTGHRLSINDYTGTGELIITFVPQNKATLTVYGANSHTITHTYNEGSTAMVKLCPETGWELHYANFNDKEVTEQIHNNDFVTDPLYGNNSLHFVFTSSNSTEITNVDTSHNKVRISLKKNSVTVQGLNDYEPVSIYDLSGTTIYTGPDRNISLPAGKTYILTTPAKTFKFAI